MLHRPLLSLLLLFFAASAGAQMPANMQSRIDSSRVKKFPPGSAEGLSAAEVQEYAAILDRHKQHPDARFTEYAKEITPEEQARLRDLFSRMNRRQQLDQQVVFIRFEQPAPRNVPSEAQFASFLDSTQYSVRIDFKPAAAADLAKYKASDFSGYSVQPTLIRYAGSQYFTYRVDLQTNLFYEKAVKRYEQSKDSYQMVYEQMRLRSERVERPAN
jgi:hypothetical protein